MAKKETPMPEDEIVSLFHAKLKEALKKVPPDVLAEARRRADEMAKTMNLEEFVKKLDLDKFTPEKLAQMAEVGYNQFKLGRYEQAERIFRGLVILDAGNYYYHQILGAIYQRQEKLVEAIVEYGMALKMNPRDTVSLANRGECYFKRKAFDLAEQDFDAAMALDPGEAGEDKWINRARMLKKQIELIQKRV